MVLDGPVAPGVTGGHSGIRYRVTDHRPQRSVTFTLEPGQQWHGTHTFSVHPTGPTQAVLRHEVDARLTGALRLLWPLAVRWLHDALVEDLLDRAEAVLGCGPARPARWSPWVRLLRRRVLPRARATAVPDTPLLAAALPRVDFADAYAVRVFPGAPTDPQVWADAIFRDPPRWVVGLLVLREAAVGLVGIARGGRSSFDTLARTDEEVLLGTDERHLDFRASVRREPQRVVLTTVVRLHNRRGRGYFALVRRVHPVVVRGMLSRAARRLSAPASGFCNAVGPGRARMAAVDVKEINRATIARFRAGEELGNGMHRERLLLLTTVGRRTGEPRTSPMMFHADGDRIVVIASNMGAPRDPDWYLNLVAEPRVTVELDTESYDGTATPLTGAERDRVWTELKSRYPFFADHEAATTRTIPVVAITRARRCQGPCSTAAVGRRGRRR